MSQTHDKGVVIVGGGAAACATVVGLRRHGFVGKITVLAEESHVPYDRPPLSKEVLSGAWAVEKTELLPGGALERANVTWLRGQRAVAVDLGAQTVTADNGTLHMYDHMVIATGVRPRIINSRVAAGVHVLRSIGDALRLREALRPDARLVVVGAGFLGLEVAATARTLGCDVVVVEPLLQPLANRVGEVVAARLLALHGAHGVRILPGASVEAIAPPGRDSGGAVTSAPPLAEVVLTDKTVLPADAVLVAVGSQPCVEWLDGSGLDLSDGVLCDQYGRAADRVWAAGDVARWFHAGLGRHARFEHRMNAGNQGAAVARGITGVPRTSVPLPFFWTNQFAARVQMWGVMPANALVAMVEGSAVADSFVVAVRDEASGRLAAVVAWNAAGKSGWYRGALQAEIDVAADRWSRDSSR